MNPRTCTRRDSLKAIGLSLASLVMPVCKRPKVIGEKSARRPNVVMFLTDDQGTLDVNCYGSTDLFTPNLDSLATSGVRFSQAYSHIVCCPARALLLTGRDPQRSGVYTWTQARAKEKTGINMALDEVTLAEALKAASYRTAIFGKWHLGAALGYGPTKQGFDEFFGIRNGFIDNYNHYQLHGNGFHDLYRGEEEVFENGKYFPDLVVAEAKRFIEKNASQPFFLYAAFNLPHYPDQADSKFDAMYASMPMPRRSYARAVSTADDRIGLILKKLEELGLRDNTVIIFASDNGHSSEKYQIKMANHSSGLPQGHDYGAHGGGGNTGKWRGAKGSYFEGGIRVPAMISFPPKVPAGAVRHQAITLADFYPTILDLCGVAPPDCELDGRSLLPVLHSAQAPSPHKTLHWQWEEKDVSWAARDGDWKLIYNGRDTTDPWQNHPEPGRKIPQVFLGNLSDEKPEYKNHAEEKPEIVRRLMKLHEEWAMKIDPRYKKKGKKDMP